MAFPLCVLLLAGCGSSAHHSGTKTATAAQVCEGARAAAARALHVAIKVRVSDRDPANIECLIHGGGARVDVVAQATPRAWEQYDTIVVHQAQAFGGGTAGDSAKLPQPIAGLGVNAAWIASQRQLVATNGSQSTGGNYTTVTVSRAPARAASSLQLAKAVAVATLAIAPRGPNPGPAPS